MKAKLRNGFVVNGRLAKIFADRGIATPIGDVEEPKVVEPIKEAQPVKEVGDNQQKRKRRTKAEIEADKNKAK